MCSLTKGLIDTDRATVLCNVVSGLLSQAGFLLAGITFQPTLLPGGAFEGQRTIKE